MEGEKILMAAGVTAAVCSVAAFVFWGPSGLLSHKNHCQHKLCHLMKRNKLQFISFVFIKRSIEIETETWTNRWFT